MGSIMLSCKKGMALAMGFERSPQRLIDRARRWVAVWLAVLLAMLAPPLSADALDGRLDVLSAYVVVDNGVYKLVARAAYPLNEDIRAALKDGVTLKFDFQAVVERQRRFWTDATLVDLNLHRELSWHMVSERFVVRDSEHGEVGSYTTIDQALQAIGSIDNWPVVVESQLEPAASYQIRVRASVRRGNLPDALRNIIWWSDGWHRSSAWYTWPLPR